ncbi:hypothetical protein TWF730_007365 [Orbilia blumenaviensis]|uniref:Uncharacterized protein n=1 Tax=Orbilia blumenaviensis TaxID=1796055 RepID=A0AAV9VAU3_9PEZI
MIAFTCMTGFFTGMRTAMDTAARSLPWKKSRLDIMDPRLGEVVVDLKPMRRNRGDNPEASENPAHIHGGYLATTVSGQQYLLTETGKDTKGLNAIDISTVESDPAKSWSQEVWQDGSHDDIYVNGTAWKRQESSPSRALEPGLTVKEIHDRMAQDDEDIYGGGSDTHSSLGYKGEEPPAYSRWDSSQSAWKGTGAGAAHGSSSTTTTTIDTPKDSTSSKKHNLDISPNFDFGLGLAGPFLRLGFSVAGVKMSI